MMKPFHNGFICLILLLYPTILQAQNAIDSASAKAIQRIMNDFQIGIIQKDSALLHSLFFDKKTPIIGVMSEATEQSIKKNNPAFEGLSVSMSDRFIREICTTSKNQLEKFANSNIVVRNRLATVSFDYVFISDGYPVQWGYEVWNLVFAENKWFITNINYLIRYPKIESVPEHLQ